MVVHERGRIRADLEEKAVVIARGVAGVAYEAVLRNDYWALYKALNSMATPADGSGNVRSPVAGMVLDTDGRVLAHLDPQANPLGAPLLGADPLQRHWLREVLQADVARVRIAEGEEGNFVESVVPIQSNGSTVGVVVLRLSTDELVARTLAAAVIILGTTLFLGLIGSLLGAYISRRMVRPLNALAQGMDIVGRGDFDNVPAVSARDRDEIGLLAEAFNRMAAELVEKRQLETQLAMNEKLAAVGRIAAGVAHEVNNPLGGMLTCIETLRRHPGDSGLMARYLPLLENGLNRIRMVVQGLLIELKADLAEAQGDGGCVEDVRELIRAEIGDRPITLSWRNDIEGASCVNCGSVQQVVLNLVKNAVQAVGDGGTVEFRATSDGKAVILEVEDDGVGISQDKLSRLFDPFFTTKPSGMGLGLWVTYRVINRLDGMIEVESEPGRGSLFRVTLPLRKAEHLVAGAA
jgi:signal transduction histidine kinase